MTTRHVKNLQTCVSALLGYSDLMEHQNPRYADLLRTIAFQLDDSVGALSAEIDTEDLLPFPHPDADHCANIPSEKAGVIAIQRSERDAES